MKSHHRLWTSILFSFIATLLWLAYVRADEYPQRCGISNRYVATYADWENAFLAGNGKMGIMVFGNPLNETVIFNDRGFNLAKTADRSFAQVSPADLETIKNECAAGNFAAADKLAASSAMYKGGGEGSRHPGYAMFITIPPDGVVSGYSRTCDFRTGEIIVKWTDNRGDWERRAFVSRKDNVSVQRLMAPSHGALTCSIHLGTDPGMGLPKSMAFENRVKPGELNLRAKYGTKLIAGYEGVSRLVVAGGTVTVQNDTVNISDAKSVLLLTRTEKYPEQCEREWNKEILQHQLANVSPDYDELLRGQVATHGSIYDRVKLDLDASAAERAKSNEELLEEQKRSPQHPVKALWERLFDSGRCYYLSASNEQTPPDLLGIWTGNSNAGWGGFYHLDANLNLQVSSGNIGDMPEAMEGYFKINESWRADFEINARKLLGCRGLLAGGNSPGPGAGLMASINDYYPYQYATGEEGWLLYPFWEHYLVTGDTLFLRDRLYPLLKEMGAFYEDFLTHTDSNGKYIFAGSVSPESQPANLKISLVNNSTFDISGAKFILTALLQSCKILNLEQAPGEGVGRWTKLIDKLPPYLINADGALQEWAWPGLNENYGHRHSSHLLTVWPYQEITPEKDPALFKAASVTLARKDATKITPGHGIVHGALIAAGLKNALSVETKLLLLSANGYYFDSLFTSHAANHGTYCADVCNTVPTVMMEMLVSSEPRTLELLPALPAGLERGTIGGVKGRNRITVESLRWDMVAKTVDCRLKSDVDQSFTLIKRSGIKTLTADTPVSQSPLGVIARVVQVKAGATATITMQLGAVR